MLKRKAEKFCVAPAGRMAAKAGARTLIILSSSKRTAMPPMIVPAPQHGLQNVKNAVDGTHFCSSWRLCIAMLVCCSVLFGSGLYCGRRRQLARDTWPGAASTGAGRMLCLRAKEPTS